MCHLTLDFFVQILFVGVDFEKMQYEGIVAELCLSCASSARQYLRVKEDSYTKEKCSV